MWRSRADVASSPLVGGGPLLRGRSPPRARSHRAGATLPAAAQRRRPTPSGARSAVWSVAFGCIRRGDAELDPAEGGARGERAEDERYRDPQQGPTEDRGNHDRDDAAADQDQEPKGIRLRAERVAQRRLPVRLVGRGGRSPPSAVRRRWRCLSSRVVRWCFRWELHGRRRRPPRGSRPAPAGPSWRSTARSCRA